MSIIPDRPASPLLAPLSSLRTKSRKERVSKGRGGSGRSAFSFVALKTLGGVSSMAHVWPIYGKCTPDIALFPACPCPNAQKKDTTRGSMALALQRSKNGCMSRHLRIGSLGSCCSCPWTKTNPTRETLRHSRKSGKSEEIREMRGI